MVIADMSLFDPNNPNPRGLENLFRALPGMAQATIQKGSGFKPAPKEFTRCCPICNEFFRPAILAGSFQMKAEQCDSCRKQLATGLTALVTTSHRWCFIDLSSIAPGSKGTVQHVSENEMDAMKARDTAQKIWKVVVKHCGCDIAGVVDFFKFAVENPPPFTYPLNDGFKLHFSDEGIVSVTHESKPCEAVNEELLKLI